MRRALLAALLTASASAAYAAPVPKEELLKPPADAAHYVVVSMAGKHGDQWAWALPDGSIASRYSQSLRGWITEVDEVMTLGSDGLPTKIVIRGVTPNGDAAETFVVADGKAVWKSTADSGEAPAASAFYLAAGGTNVANIPLAAAMVKAGQAGLPVLPSGKMVLEKGATMQINGPKGPETVQLAWVRGLLPSPTPIWLDTKGNYFAEIGAISTMPAGYEGNLKPMIDFQDAETAKAVRDISHRFLEGKNKAPVLFDNVQLFDADGGKFVANQAVLLSDGKMAKIGAAGSIKAPAGARIDRRPRQDAGSRPMGQPPAHRRRLECHRQHGDRHYQFPQPGHRNRPRGRYDQAPQVRRPADGRAVHFADHRQEGPAGGAGRGDRVERGRSHCRGPQDSRRRTVGRQILHVDGSGLDRSGGGRGSPARHACPRPYPGAYAAARCGARGL